MQPEVTTHKIKLSRRVCLGLGLASIGTAILAISGFSGPVFAAGPADITYMKPDAAHAAALAGEIVLIDVRRPDEWHETGIGEGATGLDMRAENFVSTLVALRRANPDLPIAVICRTGNRTGYLTTTLAAQGFPGLVDVNEGMVGGANGPGWLKRGLPTYAGNLENVASKRSALLP